MIVHNMEQRSQEWYEVRKGKVTGTAAKGLFTPTDTLKIDLVSQMLEEYDEEDFYISDAMQRGIDLEPEARAELSREIFVEFEEFGFLQNSEIPILGISPDGVSKDHTIQCELKCPAAKKHTETIIADEIPSDNIHQVLHAFVVNDKLERMYFASYRPENELCPLWYKETTRDSLVDLGWKKTIEVEQIGKRGKPIKPKEVSVPDIKTVSEWVEIATKAAKELNLEVEKTIKQLKEKYK